MTRERVGLREISERRCGMRVAFPLGMWIPVKTAARMLGVSRQRVYELIRQGGLAWCKMDNTVLVGRSSVEERISRKDLKNAS